MAVWGEADRSGMGKCCAGPALVALIACQRLPEQQIGCPKLARASGSRGHDQSAAAGQAAGLRGRLRGCGRPLRLHQGAAEVLGPRVGPQRPGPGGGGGRRQRRPSPPGGAHSAHCWASFPQKHLVDVTQDTLFKLPGAPPPKPAEAPQEVRWPAGRASHSRPALGSRCRVGLLWLPGIQAVHTCMRACTASTAVTCCPRRRRRSL